MTQLSLKQRVKLAARVLIKGNVSNVSEDEQVKFLFSDLAAVDDLETAPRLNVLVPSLSIKSTFGGVSTLVELPLLVYLKHLRPMGWRIRYICLGQPLDDDSDNVALKYAVRNSVTDLCIEYTADGPTKVGKNDVFMGSMWQHFYDSAPLRAHAARMAGCERPYISMIQDYEAGFFPWSSAFMLAQSLYEYKNQITIVNSHELADYYQNQGHPTTGGITAFAPVLNDKLRDILDRKPRPQKKKKILFYGRPNDRRNCFYLVKSGLELWAANYPHAAQWEVVSVGAEHPLLDLGAVKQSVLGKLTLEGYAQQLEEAAVGVSLMASPHPSYPPLEMAHFGAITLTNTFNGKDLSAWHDNFRSLRVVSPVEIARQLEMACESIQKDPNQGIRAQTRRPEYLQPFSTSTLHEIGALMATAMSTGEKIQH